MFDFSRGRNFFFCGKGGVYTRESHGSPFAAVSEESPLSLCLFDLHEEFLLRYVCYVLDRDLSNDPLCFLSHTKYLLVLHALTSARGDL